MHSAELILHACEQVLRFTRAANWHDLSEERKVQLGFNLGIVSLGLCLSKTDGYDALAQVRQGTLSMAAFNTHLARLIAQHGININAVNINKEF